MNKKKNVKTYVTFALIMLASILLGFFIGVLLGKNKNILDGIDWNVLAASLYIPLTVTFGLLFVCFFGAAFIIYGSASSKYRALENADDEEFEAEIQDVELRLSNAMLISAAMFILSLLFFPAIILCDDIVDRVFNSSSSTVLIVAEIIFILVIVCNITVSALAVKLEKKINPEKKGNVFELSFKKKWIASMDEGELMKLAQGTQKAYFAGMLTGLVLWLISILTMLAFNTGLMPVIVITIMMMVLLLTAELNSRK